MKTNLKIILRNDFVSKNGAKPVYLRVTINRKVKNISLSFSVKEKNFFKGQIRPTDPDYQSKNLIIDSALNRAKKIDLEARVSYLELSLNDFCEKFFNYVGQSTSLYEFYEKELPYMKSKLAPDTLRGYTTLISKLKKFRSSINFQDVTIQFLKNYEMYMISLGNDESTANKRLSFVRMLINRAIESGIKVDNPFNNFPLKRTESTRQHLTFDELKVLHELYYKNTLPSNKANVLRYFLFCCYTGLRYKDIKGFRFSDMQEVESKDKKHLIIVLDMHKTGKPVRIPMSNHAIELLPLKTMENPKVFKVFSDQPTNRYLKDIMKEAKIAKSISFHCSRHTFATVARALGIPLDIISSILGHQDLKTTGIYTKYDDRERTSEMEKFQLFD